MTLSRRSVGGARARIGLPIAQFGFPIRFEESRIHSDTMTGRVNVTTDKIRKLEAELERERARAKKGPLNAFLGLGFLGYAMLSSSIAVLGFAFPPLAAISVAIGAILVIGLFFVGFKKLLFGHPVFCLMILSAVFLGVLWRRPAEEDMVQAGFWFFFAGVLGSFSLLLSKEARKRPRIYVEAIVISFVIGILIMNAPARIPGLIAMMNESIILRSLASVTLILSLSAWAWLRRS